MKPSASQSTTSQCVVSAADFLQFWRGKAITNRRAALPMLLPTPTHSGPERRANAHDRRFYNGQGGRRLLDRKS